MNSYMLHAGEFYIFASQAVAVVFNLFEYPGCSLLQLLRFLDVSSLIRIPKFRCTIKVWEEKFEELDYITLLLNFNPDVHCIVFFGIQNL